MRESNLIPSLSLKSVVGLTVDQRAEPVPEIQVLRENKTEVYKKYKMYKVSQVGMIGSNLAFPLNSPPISYSPVPNLTH